MTAPLNIWSGSVEEYRKPLILTSATALADIKNAAKSRVGLLRSANSAHVNTVHALRFVNVGWTSQANKIATVARHQYWAPGLALVPKAQRRRRCRRRRVQQTLEISGGPVQLKACFLVARFPLDRA
jgi:hypothetical protein